MPDRSSLQLRLSLLSVLVLALAPLSSADPSRHRLLVDVPPQLSTGELHLEIGGQPAVVHSLQPAAERPGTWEIVVYLDASLSRSRSLLAVTEELRKEVQRLTALGTVEIVTADPDPRITLPATRDRALLERTLTELSLQSEGRDGIRRVRRALAVEEAAGTVESSEAADSWLEEVAILQHQHDRLIEWAARRGVSERPRALLLVADALTIDPGGFYLDRPSVADLLAGLPGAPRPDELATTLAAYGWLAFPVLVEESSDSRLSWDRSGEVPVGFRLKLGPRDRQQPEELQLADSDLGFGGRGPALRAFAERTGGHLIAGAAALTVTLHSLSDRQWLSFEWPLDGLGEAATVVLRTALGEGLPVPGWLLVGTPEAVASARLRSLLDGEGDEGPLDVLAVVARQGAGAGALARVEARVEPSDLGAAGLGEARLSIGARLPDGTTLERHVRTWPGGAGRTDPYRVELTIPLPPDADEVVVGLEDLSSGQWGATLAAMVTQLPASSERGASAELGTSLLPSPKVVRLTPVGSGVKIGKQEFRAEVTDPRVVRVEFQLDGESVGGRRRPPYEVRMDLGPVARRHTVEAVALGEDGREIDRDALMVNVSASSFWVRITRPRSGRASGAVDVEVDVQIPSGRALERLDLYWREELMGTLRRPPWRQRLLVPTQDPRGYIRAVGKLYDGEVAEDVVLLNAKSFGGEVAVELRELYVVVNDRHGQPVPGLAREDFVIRDGGRIQEIATFATAGDLPLTVGMALDASGSLFRRLPQVQRAARTFVESLASRQDRAFLVGFASQPWVVQPTTGDLRDVISGIDSLAARGRTAIWEAISLSLVQLQEVTGRKALLVFYDGDDEDEGSLYRGALALAREDGVPIYLVVMNNDAARTGGRGFRSRAFVSRLEKVARAGGGRVFFVRTDEDLLPIFSAISEELRSHYLLAYYPDEPGSSGRWRPVEVETPESGLTARTLAGYAPR